MACASPPTPVLTDGRAAIVGRLAIVQREGLPDARSGGAAYADRRLRDVELVDYSRPGFSVVHLETDRSPKGRATLRVAENRVGRSRIEPAHAVVGRGGAVELSNGGTRTQLVSIPNAGVVRPIPPGESIEIAAEDTGELEIFLLDGDERATVLIVAGPWAVVDPSGHFALGDLEPGRFTLHAWHPRLPPWAGVVELVPDRSEYIEIELGVGRAGADREAR